MLAGLEDILIGHEQAVAEEVVFEVLPGFFGVVAFGGQGRDIDQGDIGRNAQRLRAMPSRAGRRWLEPTVVVVDQARHNTGAHRIWQTRTAPAA